MNKFFLGLQPKKWFKSINISGTSPISVEIMETEPEFWQAVAAAAAATTVVMVVLVVVAVAVVLLVVMSYETTVSIHLLTPHKIHY